MSAKIIVELDGESHDFEERQKADQSRGARVELDNALEAQLNAGPGNTNQALMVSC